MTGWAGMIRVDGNSYAWMGNPGNGAGPVVANQTAFSYTSTRSIFTFDVGGLVQLTATFLSPLTPDDRQRQSLIFSYLEVEVQSLDGNSHDVQLYADISAGKFSCQPNLRLLANMNRMGCWRSHINSSMGLRCY